MSLLRVVSVQVIHGCIRFILEARCLYFRVMFRSSMAEQRSVNRKVTEIVVPDSRDAILRLLTFVYTNQVLDTSDHVCGEKCCLLLVTPF